MRTILEVAEHMVNIFLGTDSMISRMMKSRTNKHTVCVTPKLKNVKSFLTTVCGRPKLKDVKCFLNGPVCKPHERSMTSEQFLSVILNRESCYTR